MDWLDPTSSDSAKQREEDMSSHVAGFSAGTLKRAVRAKRETTLGSEVSGGKSLKWSGPNEEA